jgi:hypothetical protein
MVVILGIGAATIRSNTMMGIARSSVSGASTASIRKNENAVADRLDIMVAADHLDMAPRIRQSGMILRPIEVIARPESQPIIGTAVRNSMAVSPKLGAAAAKPPLQSI